MIGLKVRVRGIVQGVGFRPFIYTQAMQNHLTGWVRNTSGGVEIEVNGAQAGVEAFLHALQHDLPPLARIDEMESQPSEPNGYTQFEILTSQPKAGDFIPISPDVSICPDCQRELFEPADRRYRYPFINCTNCGPRFTIIQDIPYDRPKTTMAGFPMCPACGTEYKNPLDRRFHAQPVACPECGPQVWLEVNGKRTAEREDAVQAARKLLKKGKILAIKGLGGFHLACDATNAKAVAELRSRKKRSDKPFALMAFDLATVEKYADMTEAERGLIQSRQRPIVILEQKPGIKIAPQVAPNQHTLGIMLAYTPLHLLLLEPARGYPDMFVMTSGNLSEEPIAYQDEDARERLEPLADAYLLHDRPIHMRTDDSVARVEFGAPYLLRRARGYAPDPVQMPFETPSILAAGAELKNTFCLTRQKYAFLSHHIGDLENYETLRSFEEGVQHFERLFRVTPERIACDLHPNYLATRYAIERAEREGLTLVQVQHHHAHLAACLADNGWASDAPVTGLSFDGTGMGTDGTIWGGEALVGGYSGYQRRFHLAYVPMPGGDASVRKPARMALAHLWAAGLDWDLALPPVDHICPSERATLRAMLEKRINAPLTSSMGRLFDAASALIGVREDATYEGQAAIELEAIADPHETGAYEFAIEGELVQPGPVWEALLADWQANVPLPALAARFHNSVARLSLQLSEIVRAESGVNTVALSGGVWQNHYLLERSHKLLEQAGFQVLVHHQVPANDGGIALGQAVVAAKTDIS